MSVCNGSSEMKTERSSIRGGVRRERAKVGRTHVSAWLLSVTHLCFGTWPIAVVVVREGAGLVVVGVEGSDVNDVVGERGILSYEPS
jgi:hypothetical protein